jgi:hypothetical protein
MASHRGFETFRFDHLNAGNELIAVFHGLLEGHAVMGGNTGHFTTAAGAAFIWYDLNVFVHGLFPRIQRAGQQA